MSEQSSAQLEREAEAARARVADTAESIRKKLTAGQLIDEFTGMFTGGDLAGGLNNLKSQVRDNPLPVALVGTGLAWLAFGQGMPQSPGTQANSTPRAAHRYRGGGSAVMDQSDGASDSSIASRAKDAADSISGALGEITDGLSETADRLRHSMLSGTSHVPRSVSGSVGKITDQEPLVVAAMGLVLGAAIGAMLPASELEKEQVGPYAERLRRNAKGMVDRGLEGAGNVASKAYEALKEEADRQGLTSGDGTSVGERIGEVVKSAAASAEEAVHEELAGDTKEAEGRSA